MSTPNPVDVAVIAARLASICREMGETMLRTSRSPIFSEARDFTTAIFDAGPRLLAQADFLAGLEAHVRHTRKARRQRGVHPGTQPLQVAIHVQLAVL